MDALIVWHHCVPCVAHACVAAGALPISWTLLPWLTTVDASNNELSGTLPWQLAFQAKLSILSLRNNAQLTGTISPLWRCGPRACRLCGRVFAGMCSELHILWDVDRHPSPQTSLLCLSCMPACSDVVAGSAPAALESRFMIERRVAACCPRFTVGLSSLQLDRTNISGPLPGISRTDYHSGRISPQRVCMSNASGFGRLPSLESASIAGTLMSAACDDAAPQSGGVYHECASIDDALPW